MNNSGEDDDNVPEMRTYFQVQPALRTTSVMLMNFDKRRQRTLTQLQSSLNRQSSYSQEEESMFTKDKFVQIFSQYVSVQDI